MWKSRIWCANTHARAHTPEAPEPRTTRGFRSRQSGGAEGLRTEAQRAAGGGEGSEEVPAGLVGLTPSQAVRTGDPAGRAAEAAEETRAPGSLQNSATVLALQSRRR